MVNVIGLIGATGLIGKHLSNHINPDASYTSKNIETLSNDKFKVLYCAAPSGNRLTANINPENDSNAITKLIAQLLKVKTKQSKLKSVNEESRLKCCKQMCEACYGWTSGLSVSRIRQTWSGHCCCHLNSVQVQWPVQVWTLPRMRGLS